MLRAGAAAAASEDADSSGGGLATPWSEIVSAVDRVARERKYQ